MSYYPRDRSSRDRKPSFRDRSRDRDRGGRDYRDRSRDRENNGSRFSSSFAPPPPPPPPSSSFPSSNGSTRGKDSMSKMGESLDNINWDLSKLSVFEKNFYIEHPHVTARSYEDAEKWRNEHSIQVIGQGVPKVIRIKEVLIFYFLIL